MNHTLESHKLFPFVAWGLVIGFGLFTYFLTVRVQEELTGISLSVERLEAKIDNMGAQNATKR